MRQQKIKVLFICMGNICRSPTAHGIFRHLVRQQKLNERFEIESAGTHSRKWHEGDSADPRSIATASLYDCDISDIRSRQLEKEDFDYYDYLIVMDEQNMEDVRKFMPSSQYEEKLVKLLSFAPEVNIYDVPDPYLHDGFERVYLMIDTACRHLLTILSQRAEL
ncbi:MAG: low molecular weight protein-tyrosine-phosphatase [Francisellaceae bacterium]